jgi:catalase
LQIPVNCPYRTRITNYQRDGPQTFTNNQEGAPNYYPNSFGGPEDVPDCSITKFPPTGDVARQAQMTFDVVTGDKLTNTVVVEPEG